MRDTGCKFTVLSLRFLVFSLGSSKKVQFKFQNLKLFPLILNFKLWFCALRFQFFAIRPIRYTKYYILNTGYSNKSQYYSCYPKSNNNFRFFPATKFKVVVNRAHLKNNLTSQFYRNNLKYH